MSTWETYNIDITHSDEDTGAEKEQAGRLGHDILLYLLYLIMVFDYEGNLRNGILIMRL